jgi:iron complex outermembrane recepter protein
MYPNKLILTAALWLMAIGLFAQTKITGKVVDHLTGEALIGANVFIEGTTDGASTNLDGSYNFTTTQKGEQTLSVQFIGFNPISQPITISGDAVKVPTLKAEASSIGLQQVNIIANVAVDRMTPVAVTSISQEMIENKVSNQEFPEVMKSAPSVYTTRSGGGFGDARINVRGFDQRNVAVMINGIPVNDMENGWVYWSNWAGLSDVTSTIQLQRGLGASRLAINSVGGTINIITKTTDAEKGGAYSYTMGNNGYMKHSLSLSSGKLKGGWAISFQGTRTTGYTYVDASYIDAWSYFGSISKQINDKHMLVLTAIGAPQQHGQRTTMDKIATYDKYGANYNSDYGYRNGEIYNLRDNFYHKPQFALNHYWSINQKATLSTSAYYSVGRGGGTGDRGSIGGRGPWGYRDATGLMRFDDIVSWNTGTNDIAGFPSQGNLVQSQGYIATESNGIIKRASMNEHNWLGLLSTLNYQVNKNLKLLGGVDLRNYKGVHYRKVVDLLGADYYLDPRNVNNQNTAIDVNANGSIASSERGRLVGVDDKIQYWNDGLVRWGGLFGQAEYTTDNGFSAFVSGSVSNTSYKRVDYFLYAPDSNSTDWFNFLGYNGKLGANYQINDKHNVYVNGGYYSRAPDFDAVFPTYNNENNPNITNEKVTAMEVGYGLRTKYVQANVNLYNTIWQDKSFYRSYFNVNPPYTASITGLNAIHRGAEADLAVNPTKELTLKASAGLGDWAWQNDVEAIITDDNNEVLDTINLYTKGLKVGNSAQTTLYLGATYKFDFGIHLGVDFYYFDNFYADFNPTSRTSASLEGQQSYKLPAYGIVDINAGYDFDMKNGWTMSFFAKMNNVGNVLYVAEASDNPTATSLSQLNGYYGPGRTYTFGAKVRF